MALDINALALAGVRGLHPYEPGKPLAELEREYGIDNAIKLASNENPLGPSPRAITALSAGFEELARYPDGNGFALKKALSDRIAVAPEQITLGNGSNDVLEFVARAFVGTDNEVVFSQHSFAVYPIVTQAVGAKAVITPAKQWGYDLAAVARAVNEKTRLIYIANPNNPTGTWSRRDELHELLSSLPPHTLCVIDEAYFEYVEEPDYPNAIQWLADFENLIVTRTFSKIYGLAGLRIGYGVSSPGIADMLNRVRQPFNVNSLALAAAAAALDDEEHLQVSRELNGHGMAQLVAGFDKLGLDHIPSAGNFVAVDVGQPSAGIYQKLLRQGVIVRPVSSYGMPTHLRVTVGAAEENNRFLDALAHALAN